MRKFTYLDIFGREPLQGAEELPTAEGCVSARYGESRKQGRFIGVGTDHNVIRVLRASWFESHPLDSNVNIIPC